MQHRNKGHGRLMEEEERNSMKMRARCACLPILYNTMSYF